MSKEATHSFQAEVRQVLDIVINSLYTDRDIFLRELVSNAADAIEKLKHLQLQGKAIFDADAPLEIGITTNEEEKTITITDYGIGMTRDELVENLGTIAQSGTRGFLKSLEAGDSAASNVIGKFGVGFYSVFMVAQEVRVYTHSWQEEGEHLCWSSDGSMGYTIEETPGQRRGCRMVIKLKEEHAAFAQPWRLKELLERYSNFVPHPILLNDERVNKVEAIWLKSKNDVTEDQYNEFYKFIAHAWDEPRSRLHFSADAPLAINSLLFMPKENPEPWGMGQTEPGVALYCRRILIDQKPRGLLPDWLRFVRGVIDSADLPLNISRETMQDSELVKRLGEVISKRFIKQLDADAKDKPEEYVGFYEQFSRFVKEGVITDAKNRESLAKLLRYPSSMTEGDKLTGLEDYKSRMKSEQNDIFYLVAPSRSAIENGPYLEAFKARGLEVLFLTEPIDEYVAGSLTEWGSHRLISADTSGLDLGEAPPPEGKALTEQETADFCAWLKETLGDRVETVTASKRLVASPVLVLVQEDARMSPQMRALMKTMQKDVPSAKVQLEVNPHHSLITKVAGITSTKAEVAKLIAEQLLDTALLNAGLLEDPRVIANRANQVLEMALS